jgi:hypothetical protein
LNLRARAGDLHAAVLPHEFADLVASLAGVAGDRGSCFVHGAKYRLVI